MSLSRQRRLPRWFAPLALLIGGLCALGGYILSGQQVRSGQAPTSIEIFDHTGQWDTAEIENQLSSVAWARDIQNLVVIAELDELESTTCRVPADIGACLGPRYGGFFDAYGWDPRPGVSVLWIDPVREIATVDVGYDGYDPNLDAVSRNVSASLSLLLVEGRLEPEHFHNAFQLLADAEAKDGPLSTASRFAVAGLAGLFGVILTSVALIGLIQFLHQRQAATSATSITRAERQEALKRAKEVYTRASLVLDEMELIKVTFPALEKRIDQWEVRYTDLARLMFEVETTSERDILKVKNADLVADSARLASLVERGLNHIEADEKFLKGESDTHLATSDLHKAIDESKALLGDRAGSWQVPSVDLKNRSATLARFDALANELATVTEPALTAYATTHGQPYPGRETIEDLQKVRGLDSLTPGTLPAGQDGLTAGDLKDLSQTSREIQKVSRRIRVPISPLLVAVTASLATLIGVLASMWTAPTETVVKEADTPYATIPENILPEELRGSALTELAAAPGEDLRPPENVTIVDNGNLINDEQGLIDALGTLGFAEDVHLVILTSSETLPDDPNIPQLTDERKLAELFPDYFTLDEEYDVVWRPSTDEIILWFAENDAALDLSFQHPIRDNNFDAYYDWLPGRYVEPGEDVTVSVWNTAVSLAHVSRNIEREDGTGSLVTTGATSTVNGVLVGLIAFVILTAAAIIVFRPLQARIARRSWYQEITDTMTALTMSLDGLKLETTHIATDTRYPADDRYTHFHEDYLELVTATEKLEVSSGHARLLETLSMARLLRSQAESLWRIRPILFSLTYWAADWDDEIAYGFAAAKEPDEDEYASLSAKLFAGTITPRQALTELDALVLSDDAGRSRSLDNTRDLAGVAEDLADRGALTLPVSKTRSFTESVTEAPRLSATDLPSFTINGDIFTNSWTTLKVLVSAIRHSQYSVITVFAIVVVLAYFFVPSKYASTRSNFGQTGTLHTITVDRQPLSVEVADYANILDDDVLVDALADINLGARAHLLIFGIEQCDYDVMREIDEQYGAEYPNIWSIDADTGRISVLPAAYFLCVSQDDMTTMLLGQYDEVSRDDVFSYQGGNPTEYLITMFENADPFLKQEFHINDDVMDRVTRGE